MTNWQFFFTILRDFWFLIPIAVIGSGLTIGRV